MYARDIDKNVGTFDRGVAPAFPTAAQVRHKLQASAF